MKYGFVIFLFFLLSFYLSATIINIPNDFATIQEGINAATDGDTVLAYPNRYYEGLDYQGKNIVVASLYLTTADTFYINQTVIDASSSFRGVTFENQEDSTAVLCGFTITGGNNNYGAAIYCFDHSSPTITHCNLINNTSLNRGSFYGNYTSAKILNCKITDSFNSGGIYLVNHSTVLIDSCIIANNSTNRGGGIYIENNSNIILKNSIIRDNLASIYGGAIFSIGSCPEIENCIIINNTSSYNGGALYVRDSTDTLVIRNSILALNNSRYDCGGVYTYNADISFIDCEIKNNSSNSGYGGAFSLSQYSNLNFINCNLFDNFAKKGGAIYVSDSNIYLSGTTIKNNNALVGGGIYSDNTTLIFDSSNLCNIYNNCSVSKGRGKDIFYLANDTVNVIVDTFTVFNPSDIYASPVEKFTFSILHSIENNLINADLYVSPEGNNQNSGLSAQEPFQSISYAMSRIYTNSQNHHTIHIANGVYSYVNTLEFFPIDLNSFVVLEGESMENTIIDANYMGCIFNCYYSSDISIKNLTLKKGANSEGGAINLYNSYGSIENCKFIENMANRGGALDIFYSDMAITDCIFQNNQAYLEGGAIYMQNGNSYISIVNSLITGNTAYTGGAFKILYSNPYIINCTISNNSAQEYGGAFELGDHQNLNLINSISYDNQPQEFYFSNSYDGNNLQISYSDIEGGYDAIVQNENSTVSVYENNIDQNPLFDTTSEHPYMLSPNSPCIDSGTANLPPEVYLPDYDLLGSPRFVGLGVDMGAYEYFDNHSNQNDINPAKFSARNYPNPFNPYTKIEYNCPDQSKISLKIFNSKGQLVKNIIDYHKTSGRYSFVWNGTDKNGKKVASGVYFYKIGINNKEKYIGKMVLLK